ncbi:MAG: M20/M25/M40 family metallo-hydrolase [candidate division Zixibacteria bacterium]|nr:M20/M25/M40 family metallo-hydrolase [candidate division Zixibacteria bacterium]
MRTITFSILVCAACAGAVLPGEFLVSSPKLVEPSGEAGIWYLAASPVGHLYLADGRALPRLAPYRVWHDDPETSTYYLVYEYEPGAADGAAAYGDFAAFGDGVYLLAATRGREAEVAAAGLRAQLVRLLPTRRISRPDEGEEPSPTFNGDVDAALKAITPARVKEYLSTLQDFKTRFSYARGYEKAAAWTYDFFDDLGYEASSDEFFGIGFDGVSTPTDGRKVWVVTDGGTIYHSQNRGNRWQRQDAPAKGFLWSVQFVNESVGYTVGAAGTCLKTTNGGTTWVAQRVPYDGYLFGVGFADAANGWIAADRGKIFHTSSGGSSWAEQNTPTGQRLYDVAMADARHGWACGRNGVILRTEDGQKWTAQNSNTTARLYGIYAVSANEAWCCGWAKMLLHTTDGGQNWRQVNLAQPVWAYFYDVRFGDAQHGYVVGLNGAFLYTADGGGTWKYKQVDEENFQSCDFATASFGLLGGSAALYRTADGGATFDSLLESFDDRWRNVVAEKKGRTRPGEVVIICGHMDSTSGRPLELAPGADDDGSGTAATLAAARALAGLDFERTLRFIAWCGEEQGLLGSRHYAQNAAKKGEEIIAVVNLDMVAYDEEGGKRDDTSDITNDASKWLGEYLIEAGRLYKIDHIFDLVVDPGAGSSDHASFWNAGYDAILLIEGEKGPGGGQDNPYYHTTRDTVDTLRMKLEVDCARAGTATVAHLARVHYPALVAEPSPRGKPGPFAVYPNPFKAGASAGFVRFDGLSGGCTVEIYDLSGHLIFSYEHAAGMPYYDWPVISDDGEAASSGVYLYRVTGAGLEKSGKLAVIR